MSEETTTTNNEFFGSTESDSYDHEVAFDMIERLYDIAKDYQVAMIKYKEYQKDAKNIDESDKLEIMADERFNGIQAKLKWLERFDTLTSSKQA